jgi:phosphoribosylanthranilate isomerase
MPLFVLHSAFIVLRSPPHLPSATSSHSISHVRRTRIKFCGITRPEDAAAAADVGADAIGINFHAASGRYVTVERAKQILAALPPFVTPVGLFVDSPVEEILNISRQLNLRHIQLHGQEQPETISQLMDKIVVKAIHVQLDRLPSLLSTWKRSIATYSLTNLSGLLLESDTIAPGGTGVENDWATIAMAKKYNHFDGLPSIIAAGGLTPATVGGVVRQIRPWAVDVSSGIESTLGIKLADKMEQFVAAVREADRDESVFH